MVRAKDSQYNSLSAKSSSHLQTDSSSEDYDVPGGGRWHPIYGVLLAFALCGASFAMGRASNPSAQNEFLSSKLEEKDPAGSISGKHFSDYDDDGDDSGLAAEYEVAAEVVSGDWFPRKARQRNLDIPPDNMLKVYHQTSPEACEGIMKTNFRLGSGGWCGKAIYFALSPEATRQKAVTDSSGHGCMIEATVNVGRAQRFRSCGRYNKMTKRRMNRMGADTIIFEPPERTGDEIIIFDTNQVVAKKIIPFNSSWMAKRWYGKAR